MNDINRKIQFAELDILKWIDKVCKENNIKYFLAAGTLLGAVRHQGFIPWDDDIDLFMLREDYEKFLKLNLENENYKLLSIYNSKDYYYPYAKVINKNIAVTQKKLKPITGYGIWVDIFPLDYLNKSFFAKLFLKINKTRWNYSIFSELPKKLNLKEKILFRLFKNKNPQKYAWKIDKIAKKNVGTITNKVCIFFAMPFEPDIYNREWFDEIISMEFEKIMFNCPKRWDDILAHRYGNYMQLPPVENRVSYHDYIINDIAKLDSFSNHHMAKSSRTVVILLAGGIGLRANTNKPKQYMEIMGKPLIAMTMERFENCNDLTDIIVVCQDEWADEINNIATKYNISKFKGTVTGGNTGIESVFNGTDYAINNFNDEDVLIVHDANRCLVDIETISKGITLASQSGQAISTEEQVCDQVIINEEKQSLLIRDGVYELLRPEFFKVKKAKEIKKWMIETGSKVNNYTSAMLEKGEKINIFEGSPFNFKVTVPSDFKLLEAILKVK